MLARAEALSARLDAARAENYAKIIPELTALGAKVTDAFTLVNAVSLEIPAGELEELVARTDVVSVGPASGGTVGATLEQSRATLNTDAYFNVGLSGGSIGFLDSGIRTTHTLFNSPPRINTARDCINGTSNHCTSGSNWNPADQGNHGTAVAHILAGNTNIGTWNRGVTGIWLSSYKVINSSGTILDAPYTRAFTASATSVLDKVISVSLLRWEDENSFIAANAESAFNAGAVVLTCQGNEGPATSQARSPGNARKVLAVGAVDALSRTIQSDSSRGPSNDGRIKPDLVGPDTVNAAGDWSNSAMNSNMIGCSIATPHVAGAAALLRNWTIGTIPNVEPGQIYALLINAGDRAAFDNTYGGGLPSLLVNGGWTGGKHRCRRAALSICPFLLVTLRLE